MPTKQSRNLSVACLACMLTIALLAAVKANGEEPVDGERRLENLIQEAKRKQQQLIEAERDRLRSTLIDEARRLERFRQLREEGLSQAQRTELDREQFRFKSKLAHWALTDFERRERNLTPKTVHVSRHKAHMDRVKEVTRQVFLENPEQSKGAALSGRALNFFVGVCGSVATHQELQRVQLLEQLGALPAQIELERLATRGTPEQQRKAKQYLALIRLIHCRMGYLNHSGGLKLQLTDEDLRHLRFYKGQLGEKLTITSEGVLPLDWPFVLSRGDHYKSYREAIELGKESGLKELEKGQGISVDTQEMLLNAADAIADRFRSEWLEAVDAGKLRGHRLNLYLTSKHFLEGMRSGVYRFISAKQVEDVQPAQFQGRSIESLICYVVRNGLQFAPCDENGEGAYVRIYGMMASYYSGLYSLRLAMENESLRMQRLDERAIKRENQEYILRLAQAADSSANPIGGESMASTISKAAVTIGIVKSAFDSAEPLEDYDAPRLDDC